MTDECKPKCSCDDNITGNFCEKVVDGCKTKIGHSKCNEPKGECTHIENDPYGLFYECTCIDKCFSGVHCEVERDPCHNHDCEGIFSRCVKSENCDDYTCDCENHLEGDRCQFYKNACDVFPLACGDGLCKEVRSLVDIEDVATPVSYDCECDPCWRHNGVCVGTGSAANSQEIFHNINRDDAGVGTVDRFNSCGRVWDHQLLKKPTLGLAPEYSPRL